MKSESINELLAGGDRRSIGRADQVATMIVDNPKLFPLLIRALWHENPLVRMRAADAAEKVTRTNPDVLQKRERELLGLLAETTEPELRWHLAVMVPRLALNHEERQFVAVALERYLTDKSSIVRTFALQGLTDLAVIDVSLQPRVIKMLREATRSGTAAMKARSRKLLLKCTQAVELMEPKFFATAREWEEWLAKHHVGSAEVLVGFYKVGSGRPSVTWNEAVDAALCFGWIDGVRRRIDDGSYCIRFTPRKARSIWSAVNIRRVNELTRQGRMRPAGEKAFAAREEKRSAIYAFEQDTVAFTPEQQKVFRGNQAAWKFFRANAAWYQKTATWWVISDKREETRRKRLATLITDSENGRRLRHLNRVP